jgi:dTDP-4-dehydrorhamnose reductase
VDASRIEALPGGACGYVAERPRYSALHSERGILLPALDNALGRYLEARNEPQLEDPETIVESRQQAEAPPAAVTSLA